MIQTSGNLYNLNHLSTCGYYYLKTYPSYSATFVFDSSIADGHFVAPTKWKYNASLNKINLKNNQIKLTYRFSHQIEFSYNWYQLNGIWLMSSTLYFFTSIYSVSFLKRFDHFVNIFIHLSVCIVRWFHVNFVVTT